MMRSLQKPLLLFSRKKTAQWLLGCFFVVTVIVPAAPVNKLLFVALTLWLLADMLFATAPAVVLVAPPAVVFSIFLYGFALSLFNRVDAALALQFLLGVLILFQICFIRRYQIDVEKLIMISSNAMVLATVLLWCATFLPGMPMAATILDFMQTYSLSAFSEREFFEDATISLHLGAAPILFVGFSLIARRFCERRRLVDFLVAIATALAMLLSASRGIIAAAAMVLMILVLVYSPRRVRVAVMVLLAAGLAYGVQAVLSGSTLLSADEVSNAGKIGHMRSFFDQLTWQSLVFGRGLAHLYYSMGAEGLKAGTEISPMDMVRYFGVFLTVILYFYIIVPVHNVRRYTGDNLVDVAIFLIYLLLSFTNPILFNSMGMLVILWYWSRIYSERRTQIPPRRAALLSP